MSEKEKPWVWPMGLVAAFLVVLTANVVMISFALDSQEPLERSYLTADR